MPATPAATDDDVLRDQLRQPFDDLGLKPIDAFPAMPTQRPSLARRGFLVPPADDVELLSLTRDPAGVLRWDAGLGAVSVYDSGRRAGRAALPPGRVVQQFAYQQIAPNQIVSTLGKLDRWLTPASGLRQVTDATGQLTDDFDGSLAAGKRVLLFIHGTFSNCDNTMKDLAACDGGVGGPFLAAALAQYDYVLTFDHPTVGVSPMLNAFDLAAALRPLPEEIDIVCHSRGGLVARWFLEGFASDALRPNARAVMIGSTIGGTSLAAPAQLRSAMDYLANIGEMLGKVTSLGAAHPFIAAAGVLMQIFTSVTRLAARTPIFDGAIALVPGLHGQSRIGNSPELLRLRSNTGASYASSGLRYYAVTANFEPKDPGWNFLQYFSKPMQRVFNWGADIIFPGENDLVADCSTMIDIADGVPIQDVLAYGTTDVVHHTNYYRQRRTVEYIRDRLGIV